MASSNIPNPKTLTGGGAGTNVAPTNSNPALSGVGSFCQLATGISAPIAETIQNTIASLNSLQGAIDGIIYAPAVGISELQRKIASGELLNNVTLKIQLNLGSILTNAAKSLATAAVTSYAATALKGVSTAITNIKSPINGVLTQVETAVDGVNRQFNQAAGQLVSGVYSLAQVPGNALVNVGLNVGGTSVLGGELIKAGLGANSLVTNVFSGTYQVIKGVTRVNVNTLTSAANSSKPQKITPQTTKAPPN